MLLSGNNAKKRTADTRARKPRKSELEWKGMPTDIQRKAAMLLKPVLVKMTNSERRFLSLLFNSHQKLDYVRGS